MTQAYTTELTSEQCVAVEPRRYEYTLGLLLMVKVVAADIQERDGAKQLLTKMNEERHRVPRLARIWAARFGGKIPPKSCLFDGGFSGPDFLHWVMDICHWIVDVVLRPNGSKGFVLLPTA